MRAMVVALAAVGAAGPAAVAQRFDASDPCDVASREAQEHSPAPGYFSFVVSEERASLQVNCVFVSGYFYSTSIGIVDYALRRTTVIRGEPLPAQWADSRSCPELRPALEKLRALQPPPVVVPGMQPPTGPLRVPVDGGSFHLWVSNGLQFKGFDGSPLARWHQATVASLDKCWSENAPAFRR